MSSPTHTEHKHARKGSNECANETAVLVLFEYQIHSSTKIKLATWVTLAQFAQMLPLLLSCNY